MFTKSTLYRLTTKVVTLFLCLLHLSGCSLQFATVDGDKKYGMQQSGKDYPMTQFEFEVYRSAIEQSDFPAGWRPAGIVIQDKLGELPFYIMYVFRWPQATAIKIDAGESISIKESEDFAKSHFVNTSTFFAKSEDYDVVSNISIPHHADEMVVACEPETEVSSLPHLYCDSELRYGRVLISVSARVFPNRWLTMNDYLHLIEVADRRMTETLQKFEDK